MCVVSVPLMKDFSSAPLMPVFPRLWRMRQQQKTNGVDISRLSPQQLGFEMPENMHHVSINYTVKAGTPRCVCCCVLRMGT
jgi:hypothetical protein